MNIELVFGAGKECFNFLKTEVKPLYLRFLKIEAFSFLVLFVAILLGGLISYLFVKDFSLSFSSLALILLVLFIFVAGSFLSSLVGTSAYNILDARYAKTDVAILKSTRANFLPYLSYCVFFAALFIIILLPLLFAFVYLLGLTDFSQLFTIPSNSPIKDTVKAYANTFLIIAVVFWYLVNFLTQFGLFELLLEKKGVLASIRASLSLVKNNIIETLAFCFVALVAYGLIETPFVFLSYGLMLGIFFAFGIPLMLLSSSFGGSWGLIIIIVLIALVLIILSILKTALQTTLILSFRYLFWKMLKGWKPMMICGTLAVARQQFFAEVKPMPGSTPIKKPARCVKTKTKKKTKK